jgi:hypothetical protein
MIPNIGSGQVLFLSIAIIVAISCSQKASAADPPAVNPFGPATETRDNAIPGYIVLSDGKIHLGNIYLTRDVRLKINDEKAQREREVPLSSVKQIECTVKKEWMEKEWKFKELTKDEKMYTGKTYPSREYEHTITLSDGRTITGPLSAIVYLDPPMEQATSQDQKSPETPKKKSEDSKTEPTTEKFLLHKRDKGEIGKDLKSLVYVKSIRLGQEAFEEGKKKIADKEKEKDKGRGEKEESKGKNKNSAGDKKK